jgi:DNA-directed RNA polymerase specialized sigma24 family protein
MTDVERDALLIAMKSLPDNQRRAVVMRDVLDLDYPEIAEMLSSDEDGVRQLVRDARVFIADALPTE